MTSREERIKIELKSQSNDNKIKMIVNPSDHICLSRIQEFFPDALNILYEESNGSFTCLFKEDNKIYPNDKWSDNVQYIVDEKKKRITNEADNEFIRPFPVEQNRLSNKRQYDQKQILATGQPRAKKLKEKLDDLEAKFEENKKAEANRWRKFHKEKHAREVEQALGTQQMTISCAQIYTKIEEIQKDSCPIEENCVPTKLVILPEELKNRKILATKQKSDLKKMIHNAPTEKDLQNIFQNCIMNHLIESEELKLEPEKPIFKNKMHADFSVIKNEKPCIPNFCLFVVELLKDKVKDNQHLGQVLMYNELILESNPMRTFVVSVLTNLKEMILFKTTRDGSNTVKKHSLPMDFLTEGLKYLKYMLLDPKCVGFDESIDIHVTFKNDTSPYYISKYLGRGTSAHVFAFQKFDQTLNRFDINSPNYVVKIFNKEQLYKKEEEIFEQIKNLNIRTKHIIEAKCFIKEKHAIVLSPLGRPLKKEKLTKSRLNDIFSCIRELQNNGIIHRDISPSHFYISSQNSAEEYVFLIDLGSAIFMDKEQRTKPLNTSNLSSSVPIPYAGSIQFAANEILNGERHDLESLVKTLFCFYHKIELPSILYPENGQIIDDTSFRPLFLKTKTWWEFIEKKLDEASYPVWTEAFKIVRDTSSPTLIDQLEKNFENKLIIFDHEFVSTAFETYCSGQTFQNNLTS